MRKQRQRLPVVVSFRLLYMRKQRQRLPGGSGILQVTVYAQAKTSPTDR